MVGIFFGYVLAEQRRLSWFPLREIMARASMMWYATPQQSENYLRALSDHPVETEGTQNTLLTMASFIPFMLPAVRARFR